MTIDVSAVIAADKATIELAWPAPWIVDLVGDPGNRTWYVMDGGRAFICSLPDRREADMIAAARNRWPVYIAAIEAVLALHNPERARSLRPLSPLGPVTWQRCTQCADADNGDEWPCPTVRALAVLAPSTDKEQQ